MQTDRKFDIKRVMEKIKKEIRKWLDHITELNLNEENLMEAINSRAIPVASYVMNVYNLRNSDLD